MATHANVSTLLLRNVPLFAMLPEDQLAVLTTVVSRKSFARGATIIAATAFKTLYDARSSPSLVSSAGPPTFTSDAP